MADKKIRIECPKCKTKLLIRYAEGIEKKKIVCPKCKEKSIVADCKTCEEEQQEEVKTQINTGWYTPTKTIGQLVYSNGSEMQVFKLKEGVNIIGRSTTGKSLATILVDDHSKVLSRRHFIITVKEEGAYYEHELCLANTNVNKTMLNSEQLTEDDVIIMNFGDTVRCGIHRFELMEQ